MANFGAVSPINSASSRRALDSAARALAVGLHQCGRNLRPARLGRRRGTRLDPPLQQWRNPVDGGDLFVEDLDPALQPQHAQERDRGLRKDFQPDGLALDGHRLDDGLAGGDARIAFAEQFEELADLQRGLGRLRAAVDSRPEGIVLFVGHFRIDQRAGLDALACRDANVALGGGQAGTCGKRALERGPERKGLRMRPARQPRADQQGGRARDARGRFGEHEAT